MAAVVAAMVLALMSGCRDDANVEQVDAYLHLPDLPPNVSDPLLYRQVGALVNGVRQGRWLIFAEDDPDRITNIDHWRDGVQHGPSLGFYDDGTLLRDSHYWNGKLHGRWRIFDGPGRLDELGWTSNDERDGIWCYWDSDTGALKSLKDWRGRLRLWKDIPVTPGTVCPHTQGAGKRHLDPADRDYTWPRRRKGYARRHIPLPL